MISQLQPQKKYSSTFLYLLALTAFFFLLEISFFIQCNKEYLSDFSFVSSKLDIPLTILPGIFYFILVQISLHFLYCVIVWWIAKQVIHFFNIPVKQQLSLSLSLWILGILTFFTLNQYYFPNSKFAVLSSIFLFNTTINAIVAIILVSLCIFFMMIALLNIKRWAIIFIAPAVLLSIFYYHEQHQTASFLSMKQPNVIIIGVDSLRPDFLSFFGNSQTTPFFDHFLQRSIVFNDAITPLARTFPSWMSILTGEYPIQNGVRFNLASQSHLSLANTLPAILKRHGYETIYATDETRFSNIDTTVGFDRILSTPMGLNDFLIGTFNDFPLSNLLINTKIGAWLFPHSYSNRAAFFAYDPNSFLQLIQPVLSETRTKPLFLAIHFCLPHQPYIWASLSAYQTPTALQRYQASIKRVDQQLQDFFVLLKANHLLDHTVVVLLSDHGEALELSGDRVTEKELYTGPMPIPAFYPPSLDGEALNESAGHGTDVLGLSQYHTLLAFRLYGMTSYPRTINGLISLLAIKPTILGLLGISSSSDALTQLMQGKQTVYHTKQPIFLESDYTPEAIRTVYPEVRKVVLEGVQLFRVDPITTRLTVRPGMGEMIVHSKQLAIMKGDWMLALYPQNKQNSIPVLINLKNGLWTTDMQSLFAKKASAQVLMKQLQQFYEN